MGDEGRTLYVSHNETEKERWPPQGYQKMGTITPSEKLWS